MPGCRLLSSCLFRKLAVRDTLSLSHGTGCATSYYKDAEQSLGKSSPVCHGLGGVQSSLVYGAADNHILGRR